MRVIKSLADSVHTCTECALIMHILEPDKIESFQTEFANTYNTTVHDRKSLVDLEETRQLS